MLALVAQLVVVAALSQTSTSGQSPWPAQDSVWREYGPLGLRTRMRTSPGHELEIERSLVGDVVVLRAGGGPAVAPDSDAKKDALAPWEAKFTRDQLGLEIERHLPGGVRSV